MKTEFKYQWSSKADNGEIMVVRADTQEEIQKEIEWAKNLLHIEKPTESHPSVSEIPLEDRLWEGESDPSWCEIHKVKMKERDGKNGKFYSHSKQLPDESWDYCSGRGFKSTLK